MNLGLHDKVALVLAASKGLGLACAKGLFTEGSNVVICSRSQENLTQAKNEILKFKSSQHLNKILYFVADLKFEDQIKALVSKTLEEFGKIDILVHNAGGPPSAPISGISKEDWQKSINLNLLSFIRVSELVLSIMQKQKCKNIS